MIVGNLIAVLLVIGFSNGAYGQSDTVFETTGDDEIALQQCHEAVRDTLASGEEADLRECIGAASGSCLDDPANQSTLAMVACVTREQKWWDAQLNFTYDDLLENLSPEGKTDLRDIQRAWIAYKDLNCGFAHRFFEGGSMAQPIAADCLMRMTAERAIELGTWLDMGK